MSVGTVSRVINNNAKVAAGIRLRVLTAARDLGYVPDVIAQSLRTNATMMVGCILADITNKLFMTAISAAEAVLRKAGYVIVLAASNGDINREVEILSMFDSRRLEGCIMTVSDENDPRIIEALSKLRMPVTLLEREMSLGIDCAFTDQFSGVYQAVTYLLTLGHRRIGLITVSRETRPGRERARGFRKAFEDFQLPVDEAWTAFRGNSPEYGYRVAYGFLSAKSPPTAIIAGANEMVGVVQAARALGVGVPEALSLISLGDTDLMTIHSPPLSVIRWDHARTGELAAELMLSRINNSGPDDVRKIILPTELVMRLSCASIHGAAGGA
ncbi:MAG: substrate-binding domain-containing protein [Bosea sp.]|nr:substrate-binding domain-containing protein [Bosea sp. (in: a-proteobacteria)]